MNTITRLALPTWKWHPLDKWTLTLDEDASLTQATIMRHYGQDVLELNVYRDRQPKLVLLAALEGTDHWGYLLHVSISFRDRYPSWREIKAVKSLFYGPDVDAMMVLPKERDYVAVHPNCFHLWQTPQEWNIQ